MKTIEINGKTYRRLKKIENERQWDTTDPSSSPCFEVVEIIPHSKEITGPIPLDTGFALTSSEKKKGAFPAYLTQYRNCYTFDGFCYYSLKPEYRKDRPRYSVTINYYTYKVTVGEYAKRYAKKELARYAKLAKSWEDLLAE